MQKKIIILVGLLILGLILYTMNNSEEIKKDTSKVVKNDKITNKVINPVQEKQKEQAKTTINKVEKQTIKPIAKAVTSNDVPPIKEEPERTDDEMKDEASMVIGTFNTEFPKILEKMKEIPKCIENAKSKDEAFKCTEDVSDMQMNLAMELDIYEDDQNNSTHDLVWNDEFKPTMIDDVHSELTKMHELKECVGSVSTLSGFDECIKNY